jgi:hypothetical protein
VGPRRFLLETAITLICRGIARWPVAILLWLAVCAAPLDATQAVAAGPDPIEVSLRPIVLDSRDPARDRVGKLIFRAGYSLSANDSRFGGWSDLDISEDGRRLTAISDRGYWFDATVEHRSNGAIDVLKDARLGQLANLGGFRQRGIGGDAEGLSRTPEGGFLVSFERRHRIWHYPPADPPFSALPRALPMPPEAARMPANGGIEAVVRLPGGRVLVLSEELVTDDGANVGWLGDGRIWSRVSYVAGPDFKPTGVARLPNGDLLVLERRFSPMSVPGGRIVRVKAESIHPDARIAGEEIARIEPPMTFDNFEGIATRVGPGEQVFVYVISDDNYFFLQRTLLMEFELSPE